MRLSISKSKNSKSFYVIQSVMENGKRTTKVVERLGTEEELRKNLDGREPEEWAREYVAKLNEEEKQGRMETVARFSPTKRIARGKQTLFNGGYLFLQAIYHGLGLEETCRKIGLKHRYKYDLSAVLSRLVYTRILYPSSKRWSYEESKRLLEGPKFELVHVYRALDVLAESSREIQAQVYQGSKELVRRNTSVLYYDCTNYFFEIEEEDCIRQYGQSKEHRPNPIVQMGLFMDGSGIPLAFSMNPGARNEQPTLKPLEQQIIDDFSVSRFIVCTDAGVGSMENRVFNDEKDRAYVVTQSLKKLEESLIEWALILFRVEDSE